MKQNKNRLIHVSGLRVLAGCVCICLTAASALAGPPLQPLPRPAYSFDGASPAVLDGRVQPGCVLELVDGNPVPQPNCRLDCQDFNLCQPGHDMDALSGGTTLSPTATFSLVFSIDRGPGGPGQTPPDAAISIGGVPYNAADQAAKGQAAGDAFITTSLFTRGGPLPGNRAVENNVLIINNYDEGGNDFGAEPETSAADTSNDPQDNVNALTPESTTLGRGTGKLYFTATEQSDAEVVPGVAPSGANIYVVDLSMPGNAPQLFANRNQLGLGPLDDINAMIVFDDNENGEFDLDEEILFSLSPTSPSRGTSSADILIVRGGPAPSPVLFAPASHFGLDGSDNIDALYFVECVDAIDCASQAGIRGTTIPTTSEWGLIAMTIVLLIVATVVFRRTKVAAG